MTDTAKVATKDLTFMTQIYEKALFRLRKHFSYQFFVFVTSFAAEAPKRISCNQKNQTQQRMAVKEQRILSPDKRF